MSEFSQLIKNFEKIRDYMRDFYIYGFRSREQLATKSLRSYDNEKRRIEGYLSEYMSFQHTPDGKNVFISVDGGDIDHNPFYRAFKAKSFTKNDITLHFILLDILTEQNKLTMTERNKGLVVEQDGLSVTEIMDIISHGYQDLFEEPLFFDVATVRNKLNEYVKLGIFVANKDGKKMLYCLSAMDYSGAGWEDATLFFSEVCPLGVVGSYLLDQMECKNTQLSFKHHYMMHVLESEVLLTLLEAIRKKCAVEIVNHSPRAKEGATQELIPCKIRISVQGGRRYVAALNTSLNRMMNYRLDYIKSVKILKPSERFEEVLEKFQAILPLAWGVSLGNPSKPDHLAMKLHIEEWEQYVLHRIRREGRHGMISKLDESTYLYEIKVLDATEMLPWLRTFIGRILSLECTNHQMVRVFYEDMNAMNVLYEGDEL